MRQGRKILLLLLLMLLLLFLFLLLVRMLVSIALRGSVPPTLLLLDSAGAKGRSFSTPIPCCCCCCRRSCCRCWC